MEYFPIDLSLPRIYFCYISLKLRRAIFGEDSAQGLFIVMRGYGNKIIFPCRKLPAVFQSSQAVKPAISMLTSLPAAQFLPKGSDVSRESGNKYNQGLKEHNYLEATYNSKADMKEHVHCRTRKQDSHKF